MTKNYKCGAALLALLVSASSAAYAEGWKSYEIPAPNGAPGAWCAMAGETSPQDADDTSPKLEFSFHVVGSSENDAFTDIDIRQVGSEGFPVKSGIVAHLALDDEPYLDATVGDQSTMNVHGHFGALLKAMGGAQAMTITFGSPDDRVFNLTLGDSFRRAEAEFLKCSRRDVMR